MHTAGVRLPFRAFSPLLTLVRACCMYECCLRDNACAVLNTKPFPQVAGLFCLLLCRHVHRVRRQIHRCTATRFVAVVARAATTCLLRSLRGCIDTLAAIAVPNASAGHREQAFTYQRYCCRCRCTRSSSAWERRCCFGRARSDRCCTRASVPHCEPPSHICDARACCSCSTSGARSFPAASKRQSTGGFAALSPHRSWR